MELRLAQAGLPVLLKGGGGSLSGHRRRLSRRDGGRSRLGGSVGLFSCLLRRPARSGRGDDREWLRRGFRLCEVRPHGHPCHGGGWRAGPVARSVPEFVPVRLLLGGGPLGGHQRRPAARGGDGGRGDGGRGDAAGQTAAFAGAAAFGWAAMSDDGVPAAAAIAPSVAAGRAGGASAGAGCTREGSMAGRAMCAGGSGPLFAPGTRRGREAGCPAIASAACGASRSGGGASCSGGGASSSV